jgi:hypothetical protein
MYFTRTLTARIHAAFSRVLKALHSLRTDGRVQDLFLGEYGVPNTDEMMARETKRNPSLRANMDEREG